MVLGSVATVTSAGSVLEGIAGTLSDEELVGEPPPDDDDDLNMDHLKDPDGGRSPSWTRAA